MGALIGRESILPRLFRFVPLFVVVAASITSFASPSTLSADLDEKSSKAKESKFSANLSYGASTDYADTSDPRSYRHSLSTGLDYELNSQLSLGVAAGLATQTINGQISKGPEETYAETLDVSASLDLSYAKKFWDRHSYSVSGSYEPLFTEDSRIEGHRAILGVSSGLTLGFFAKRYSLSQSVSASNLINRYEFNTKGGYNPDTFYSYSLTNSLRFFKTFKLSHTFGVRATRYLDGFVGYAYSHKLSLAKSWQSVTASLSYTNGGFTDDGYVRLWYLDQYRRIYQLGLSYAF